MAITKLNQAIQDTYGLDFSHSVIEKINLDFKKLTLYLLVKHFEEPIDFNQGKLTMFKSEYVFDVTVLPASVITDALSLKNTVEIELIANHPEYVDGVQVNDDGTPIV